MQTVIHWLVWFVGDDTDGPDVDDLRELVELARKYPNAEIKYAEDSDYNAYWVFASGDLSDKALTDTIDKRFSE